MDRCQRTAEQGPSIHQDSSYVNGRFFSFSGNVATCCNNEKRFCFAVGIFEVETTEEDSGGCDDALPESEFFTQFRDD